MITCKDPTEHYSSGRELLLAWDTDMNKWLSENESEQAILAYLGYVQPPLTLDEMEYVAKCYMDYGGDINAMCPKQDNNAILTLIILIGIGLFIYLLIGGKK